MELDGYCPSLQLAFEYQGEQHYVANNYFNQLGGSFIELVERDRLKAEQSKTWLTLPHSEYHFAGLRAWQGRCLLEFPRESIELHHAEVRGCWCSACARASLGEGFEELCLHQPGEVVRPSRPVTTFDRVRPFCQGTL